MHLKFKKILMKECSTEKSNKLFRFLIFITFIEIVIFDFGTLHKFDTLHNTNDTHYTHFVNEFPMQKYYKQNY